MKAEGNSSADGGGEPLGAGLESGLEAESPVVSGRLSGVTAPDVERVRPGGCQRGGAG